MGTMGGVGGDKSGHATVVGPHCHSAPWVMGEALREVAERVRTGSGQRGRVQILLHCLPAAWAC